MNDSESSPITTPAPAAEPGPSDPTISVTRRLEPPLISLQPESPSDPTAQKTWHPTPTDATPPMSGPPGSDKDSENTPTRIQDASAPPPRQTRGLPAIRGYEIEAEIGRGGMGVVFKARHLELNRPVAIKMILGDGYERPEQLVRFKLEAEMAARIRHPNVVQVHDSDTEPRPYLVLEWVDGGTLSSYLKGQTQQPRAAARTISLLARAVHAIHCAGIVHRDLKPGNVLVANLAAAVTPASASAFTSTVTRPDMLGVTLSFNGQPIALTPKVTDFGLAKRLVEETHLTETGRVLGTPEYMAPEQAKGQVKLIGPGTDIYALGIILYQMLTGQTPFHDSSVVAIMRRLIEEEPKPPRTLQPRLPRDLETICLKCLEKNPDRRYATADALADDLDAFLDGRPISARPTGSFERVWKWAARRPAVAAATAAAAFFFILGFAGVTWQWREKLNERNVAVGQRDRAVRAEGAAIEQRDRAVKAEAITDAVNRFLIDDMLNTATPEKQLGRKITVEEVLQNASARIEGSFANQPDVAAGVRQVLGNSYRKLGLFPPAEKHLAASLELRRQTLGDTHRDTLAAAADRGLLLADERKLKEAVPLMRQVAGDAKAKLGPDDPLTIEASGRLALVLQENGDTPEAERLYRDTLANARRVFGPADPRTLTILNDLGQLLMARKQLPEAEATFRQAAEGREKALAPTHPATLESKHNLAAVLDDEGRWAEAKSLYQQELADKTKVLGRAHVDTLQAMNLLAALLERHGDLEAALLLYEDALSGFREALSADNPLTLNVQSNLGQFAFRFGMRASRPDLRERAETILTAVLDARRRVLPPNHPDILRSCNNLAVVLIALRRLDDAEPLMKEALAGQRKTFGPGHPETLRSVDNYSQFLRDRRKLAEAIGECEDALDAAAKEKSTEHPQAVALLCTLSELLSAQNDRLNDALDRANQAVVLTRKVHGDSSDEFIRARRDLGVVLLLLNRPAEAEPHLRSVYDASMKGLGATHTRTVRDAGKLGACLLAEKRFEDAEPLLIGCYQTVRGLRDVPAAQVRAYGEQVVKLYEAWGKPEKAAEWREKLK